MRKSLILIHLKLKEQLANLQFLLNMEKIVLAAATRKNKAFLSLKKNSETRLDRHFVVLVFENK